PVKQNGEVFFASGHRRLLFPKESTTHSTHRNLMILFRADVSSTVDAGQGLFAVNGVETGTANRQPFVSINPGKNSAAVTWRTPNGSNIIANLPVQTDKSLWNCIV